MNDYIHNRAESKLMALLVQYPEKVADKIFGSVSEDMLFSDTNREIFKVCQQLKAQGKDIDVINIRDPLLVGRIAEALCAFPGFGDLNLNPLIRSVYEEWQHRQAASLGKRLLEMSESKEDIETILASLDDFRSSVYTETDRHMFSLQDLAAQYGDPEVFAELSEPFVKTGLRSFDTAVTIKRGDLIILAGRPSMGKTDSALLLAKHMAGAGHPVGIVSLEMRAQYLLTRLAKSFGSQFAEQGASEADQYMIGVGEASKLPIMIDDTPAHNINTLRVNAKRMVKQMGIQMLIVDYLTLLDPPKAENRNQEVTKTSRELKHMANELDIPVMVLAQLNRKVEERTKKRPQLSDLRESGSIEQDADIVLFAYRPEYYGIGETEHTPDTKNYLELISAKQREGARGSIQFYYDPAKKILADWGTVVNQSADGVPF